jgi:hypothetical protein
MNSKVNRYVYATADKMDDIPKAESADGVIVSIALVALFGGVMVWAHFLYRGVKFYAV